MDWEDDEEFEASLLEIEESKDVSHESKVEVKFKSHAVSSTPLHNKPNVTFDTMSSIQQELSECNRSTLGDLDKNVLPANGVTDAFRTKKRRKFPGPAGTLPKLTCNIDLKSLKDVPAPNEGDSVPEPALSQSSQPLSVNCNPSWKRLINDLDISLEHLKKHSIQNTLVNASRQRLPDGKAPLLVVAIEMINKSFPDATVTLKDLTGSMQGVIHRLLMKQYNYELKVGSVLLLKQVAVFSPALRRKYLNITPNNLLQIYSEDEKTAKILRKTVKDLKTPLNSLLAAPILQAVPPPDQTSRNVCPPNLLTSAVSTRVVLPATPQPDTFFGKTRVQSGEVTNPSTFRLTNKAPSCKPTGISVRSADQPEFSGDDDDFEDVDLYDL